MHYTCSRCKEHGDEKFWRAHACGIEILLMRSEEAEQYAAGKLPQIKSSVGKQKRTAVIPVYGAISRRPSLFGISQGEIKAAVLDAVNDPGVGSIVLSIDSPGGDHAGTKDLVESIAALRGSKPIIAVTEGMAASAALWVASAADKIIASSDAQVGSVGSVIVHMEQSKLLGEIGLKVTVIRSGEHKFEGSSFEPLSEGAKERYQARVDEAAATFKESLRSLRAKIKTDAAMGSGEVFSAKEALARGLIDGIGTLESVISELNQEGAPAPGQAEKSMSDLSAQERAELEALREGKERQRQAAFDGAKAKVLDPLRQKVMAGKVQPSILEDAAMEIEAQRKAWAEGSGLTFSAALVERMSGSAELPKGEQGKQERKSTLRSDEEFAQRVKVYAAEKRIDYLKAWGEMVELEPDAAKAYWAGTAGKDFHNFPRAS